MSFIKILLQHELKIQISSVCDSIFNAFLYVNYINSEGHPVISGTIKDGFDMKKAIVPKFNYVALNYAKIINEIWVDVIILLFYGIVFFIVAYFKFLRMNIV